mmetsp:Transcript_60100/g.125764  ORF Transcript_60100/g.125764 Transcript_60100/m.125764 type:complete len:87 (+) Transcript_60100:1091-1351(+)
MLKVMGCHEVGTFEMREHGMLDREACLVDGSEQVISYSRSGGGPEEGILAGPQRALHPSSALVMLDQLECYEEAGRHSWNGRRKRL